MLDASMQQFYLAIKGEQLHHAFTMLYGMQIPCAVTHAFEQILILGKFVSDAI